MELRLSADPTAPTLARAGIARAAKGLPEGLTLDLLLLTSEVVTNAVRHGEMPSVQEIVIRLEVEDRVRVEVVDGGKGFASGASERPRAAEGGFGLRLVDRLATSWGVEPEGVGTKVWFELGARSRLVEHH